MQRIHLDSLNDTRLKLIADIAATQEQLKQAEEEAARCQLVVETYEANHRFDECQKNYKDVERALQQLDREIKGKCNNLDILERMPGMDTEQQIKETRAALHQLRQLVEEKNVEKSRAIDAMHNHHQVSEANKKNLRGRSFPKRERQQADVDLLAARKQVAICADSCQQLESQLKTLEARIVDVVEARKAQLRLAAVNNRLSVLREGLEFENKNYIESRYTSDAITILMLELIDLKAVVNNFKNDALASELVATRHENSIRGFLLLALKNNFDDVKDKEGLDVELEARLKKLLGEDKGSEANAVAVATYLKLKAEYPNAFPHHGQKDVGLERGARYMELRDTFHRIIKTSSDKENLTLEQVRLNKAGNHLIQALDKSNSLSFAYRVEVLYAAKDAYEDVHSHDKLKALSAVIDKNTDGKGNEVMEVVGSVMMIVGAIMAMASVFVAIVTLGFAAPLCIAGLAIGTAIFGTGVGLVLASAPKRTEEALHDYRLAQLGLFKQGMPKEKRHLEEYRLDAAAAGGPIPIL